MVGVLSRQTTSGLHSPPEGPQSRGRCTGAEGCRGYIHVDKSQCGPPQGSASTARISAVAKCALLHVAKKESN